MKSISQLKNDARHLELREDWEKAIQIYLLVLDEGQKGEAEVELPLYNRVGDLYVRLGREHDAVRYYEQAADRYADAGLYNNAIALCNKALRYQPNQVGLLRKLGVFSGLQGFHTDARHYFVEYADRQVALGKVDDALNALEDFARIADDADARELFGHRLQAHGRTREAVAELTKAFHARVLASETEQADALRDEILTLDPSARVDGPRQLFTAPDASALDAGSEHERSGDDYGLVDVGTVDMIDPPLDTPLDVDTLEGLEPTSLDFGAYESDRAGPDLGPDVMRDATSFSDHEMDESFDMSASMMPDIDLGLPPDVDEAMPPTGFEIEGPGVDEDADELASPDDSPLPLLDDLADGFELPALPDGPFAESDADAEEEGSFELPLLAEDEPGLDLPLLDAASEFVAPGTPTASEPESETVGDTFDGEGPDPTVPATPSAFSGWPEDPEDDVSGGPVVDEPTDEVDPELLLVPDFEQPPDAADESLAITIEDTRTDDTDTAEEFADTAGAAEEEVVETAPDETHGSDVVEPVIGESTAESEDSEPDTLAEPEADTSARSSDTPPDDVPPSDMAASDMPPSLAESPDLDLAAVTRDVETSRVETSPPAPRAAAAASGYVDLGSLLVDDDEETTRFRIEETAPSGDEDQDFAELLSRFKEKVAEHVPPEDAAAHYDLGLAFKEMGLIDEAIGEFQVALRSGHMRLKVYEELGHCFLHRQQYNIAEKVLRQALLIEPEHALDLLGIYYQLGRAYEAMGNADLARDAYEHVIGMDFKFQDAADRLARL